MSVRYQEKRGATDRIIKDFSRRLMLAGAFVQTDAKLRCPVDTGRLRASISVKEISDLHVRVGTNVEYAPFVELGTRYKGARPYLVPALIDNRREIKRIIKSG